MSKNKQDTVYVIILKNLKINSIKVNSSQKAKSKVAFLTLKWKNIGGADAITRETLKNSSNVVFRSKQTAKKAPRRIFRHFQVTRTVRLIF